MAEEEKVRTHSLRDLLGEVEVLNRDALVDRGISGISGDSRQVGPGFLFVAVPGLRVDGHDYVHAAVEQGCGAVLVGPGRCRSWPRPDCVCVEVADTGKALGQTAAAFFRHPARRLVMIGITGTNGKTTSTYLLESIIRQGGGNPGVIGTVSYRYNNVVLSAPFTTPDSVALQRMLSDMADAGVTHVVMEVSSHALAQNRLAGVTFDVALFTNLSRDHLDFHGSMENYFVSKKSLFVEYLKQGGRAVVVRGENAEEADHWAGRLTREVRESWGGAGRQMIECGFASEEVAVLAAGETLAGTEAHLKTPAGELRIRSAMVGRFNLKNILGAVGVGMALNIPGPVIEAGLAAASAAPGRLERVIAPQGVGVFVDYAHTPDALENVLLTMRRLTSGRLLVLFGCGGDRDRGKRALMGMVAGRLADVVVLTSDNPRSESPEAILADIEEGLAALAVPRMRVEAMMHRRGTKGYDIIADRRTAIRTGIRCARAGDVVLICGKGHENYQITRQGKTFFDDRVEAALQSAVFREYGAENG